MHDIDSPESTSASSVRLDELPDGVLIIDGRGIIREANQAFFRLLERDATTIIGKRVEDLIAEEDILQLLGGESFLRNDSVSEVSIIFSRGDGRPLPLLVSFSRARNDLQTVLVLRAHGEVRAELQDASRWIASEQERSQDLQHARDALEHKNAALRATQVELERAYETLQAEVAARERLEHELRLAQKLEAVGQLAAGLAHEINTPMQYIGDNGAFLGTAVEQLSAFARIARAAVRAESGRELDELAEEIEAAASANDIEYVLSEAPRAAESLRDGVAQVSKIVHAMKSFARSDQVEKSPADLNRAISDTLLVSRGEYKHVLTVETDLGELPLVSCQVSAVNQALLNLIINASHAVIDAKREGQGKLRVVSRVVDESVEIRIEDNGCGIPEAVRHRIFDQFFTTKQVGRGTGQGLAIARRIIVELHGGSLTFESEIGRGTTFFVRIPIEPPVAVTQ